MIGKPNGSQSLIFRGFLTANLIVGAAIAASAMTVQDAASAADQTAADQTVAERPAGARQGANRQNRQGANRQQGGNRQQRANRQQGAARPRAAAVHAGAYHVVPAGHRTEMLPMPNGKQRPNVLFILIDDLRPDLGIYGHPIAITPNIDALGRSGIVFDNAFVSQAVCGPSRAALMTGLRPDTTGITTLETPMDQLAPNAVTILDLFRGAGYKTMGYGKIYHHSNDDHDGWDLRLEDAEHTISQAERRNGVPRLSRKRADDRSALPDTLNVNAALQALPGLKTDGKPFLMAVGIHRPHLPFVAPASDWDKYENLAIPAAVNPSGQNGAPPWAITRYEVFGFEDTRQLNNVMPDHIAEDMRRAYLANITYADSLVGDLMAGLKAQGLDENTIVVLWGDHGWKLGDLNGWSKHTNANIDIHIPLIVRAPGATRAGSRTSAIVETVDIYPTLAELAGLKAPDNLEGLSLTRLFANGNAPWKQAAFAQYGRNGAPGGGRMMGYTVRTDQFRYTAWVTRQNEVIAKELYDLKADPTEGTNVADQPRYSADVTRMEAIRTGGWRPVRDAVAPR